MSLLVKFVHQFFKIVILVGAYVSSIIRIEPMLAEEPSSGIDV